MRQNLGKQSGKLMETLVFFWENRKHQVVEELIFPHMWLSLGIPIQVQTPSSCRICDDSKASRAMENLIFSGDFWCKSPWGCGRRPASIEVGLPMVSGSALCFRIFRRSWRPATKRQGDELQVVWWSKKAESSATDMVICWLRSYGCEPWGRKFLAPIFADAWSLLVPLKSLGNSPPAGHWTDACADSHHAWPSRLKLPTPRRVLRRCRSSRRTQSWEGSGRFPKIGGDSPKPFWRGSMLNVELATEA